MILNNRKTGKTIKIFMEKVGTGIRRIRKFCLENNNAIDIMPGDTYFSVEMKSPKELEITDQNIGVNVGVNVGENVGVNVGVNVGEDVGVNLSKNQNLILQLLLENKELSIEKLAESLGIAGRSIERNISLLKEKGLLERVGSDRTGYWNVTAEGAQILRGIK